MNKLKNASSVIGNIFYFVRLMFSISPVFVILEMIWGLITRAPGRLIGVLGMKYIIDVVESGENLERIWIGVGAIAAVLVVSHLLSWLYTEFYWNIAKEKLSAGLSKKLYEKAREIDLQEYDNPDFYNDFILNIESSTESIQYLLGNVKAYFTELVLFFTIGAVIFTIDPVCLLIIVVTVVVFLPLSRIISSLRVGRRKDNAELHHRSDYFQRIFYLQDYTKEVRMNNISPLLIDRYNEAADAVIENQNKYWKKLSFFSWLQETGMDVLGLMFVLPAYLGYCVLVKHSMGAGDFVATFNGAYQIAASINILTIWAVTVFSERGKIIEKYREFLACEPKIKGGTETASCDKPETIEIRNLSFTYPGSDHPVLKNINLTIKPYEKIALVGYNGAGKTTLTNLLLRLYEPTEGGIYIGGKNIKDVTLESHKDRFSAVFQDFQTYACTIGENVALDVNPDEGRVIQALKHSGFSKPLKNGVDTEILREFDDNGTMLSGGESQKMAVARAFYKDCPYAILDEPSANLDPIAEYELNKTMLEAAEHKTVIFISHRLSTTVGADKIYVMADGEIIESGSHAELMEKNGTYAYMFNLQAEKYLAADDK
ncbi:MAG: ABC transporter ATP-binding protein [Clostridia bacterium]|nr:ABC transporter ATP-binding protein [Clostridia bacterium]